MTPPQAAGDAPAFDQEFRAKLSELFAWRRDVRHFRREPPPASLVDALLETAALAPSVGLSQPWRFVTVEDPSRRAAMRGNFTRCNAEALAGHGTKQAADYARLKLAGLDEAPCHLAVFAEPEPEQGHGLGRRTMRETTAYSAVMAIHTLWLAARAAGLGLGWVSILDPVAVSAALDLPVHWTFIGYLCLGYPACEAEVPELESCGWEWRRPAQSTRLRR
jgi:5,6-dimethylbenzimidazole synthase